ncbi:hypothetical protein MTR_1g032960 [Medicago truncatula]|uniref:Uncharacterized protein n=1 Tax=Medicago truncatula TaxID=3880 RepID=A0A072VF52_MEDTR|nr:hypothetical protein MTR_1g032960 [Medicago truncatula]
MEQPEGFVIHGQEDKVNDLLTFGSKIHVVNYVKSLFINNIDKKDLDKVETDEKHLHAIERFMRFLKKTMTLGLHYEEYPIVLE